MPFDGTPVSAGKVRLLVLGADGLTFGPSSLGADAAESRALPPWHSCRRSENVGDTLAVLARARQLLADGQRWCRGSFARGWRDIPVPVGSVVARRYCALGAIMRAGHDLSVPVQDACAALEWQIGRPVQDWNDDPLRTHREVIAVFEAAVAALEDGAA